MTNEEIIAEWRRLRSAPVLNDDGKLRHEEVRVIEFARSIIAAERVRCAKIVRGLIVDGPTTTELVAGANIALGVALKKINND